MTESFSDLWASSNPVKLQQPQLKTLGSAVGSSSNATRRTTPDAFSMLAAAGSSQPNSRPITPSSIGRQPTSKSGASSAGDAFGGLVSFGGSSSRDDGLTIAERAAKVERDRREKLERDQSALQSQGSFWDKYEGAQTLKPSKPAPPAKSNGQWDLDFLTSESTPPPQPSKTANVTGSAAVVWDLDFLSSEPAVSVTPPTANPSQDIFDVNEFATLDATQAPRSGAPSRADTPGSFDFGNREDMLLADGDDDNDDILGSLAKPVDALRRASPTSARQTPSPAPSRHSPTRAASPPPHVLGQIVEMGFSIQQARVALAATRTGLDVNAALEILLQNTDARSDGRNQEQEREEARAEAEAEAEVERKRRRRQGPSRAAISSPGTSSPSAQQQGLQDQADKILAQASTIGLSMFNKANAFWKEGREKVVKVYEEQRTGSAGGDAIKDKGRPRWMDEARSEDGDFVDEEGEPQPRENRATAQRAHPAPTPEQPKSTVSLFEDEEPVLYKSPARRRPLVSGSASKVPSPSPSPIPAPSPITRPTIVASALALVTSNAHKSTGTEHFKLGRFAEADTAYSSAIAALPVSHLLQVPLYNNRALTRLRTGDYKGTVDDASEVVRLVTAGEGIAWHPGREAASTDVDLGDALGKALRRRAEAYEGLEKWKEATGDWERLSAAGWIGPGLRGEAVKGAGRCRRMAAGGSAPAALPSSKPKSMPKLKPARALATAHPSEALSRVRAANTAQEAEDQARHDLKDIVDGRLAIWRAGKEANLRALIASLDTVLWPTLGWQKVGMAELVSPGQVKLRYTKAIAKLHPDKLNGNNTTLEQRMIANGVFGTLNEAWNTFR